MYVWNWVFGHVCVHVYMCVHVCFHKYGGRAVCMCDYVWGIWVCMRGCMHICVDGDLHVCICVCVHMWMLNICESMCVRTGVCVPTQVETTCLRQTTWLFRLRLVF